MPVGDVIEYQNPRLDPSTVDVAYRILRERREPMKYKELVQEVLVQKGMASAANMPRLMAKAHTDISMDYRFLNRGGGMCGLREWTQKPPSIKVVELPNADRPKPGERLRRELVVLDEDYQEEPTTEEDPIGEPEEPEVG
jgi:DNA-directed RNA polymerase subunit delta